MSEIYILLILQNYCKSISIYLGWGDPCPAIHQASLAHQLTQFSLHYSVAFPPGISQMKKRQVMELSTLT